MSILFSGDNNASKPYFLLKHVSKYRLINRYTEDLFKKIKYHIILGDRCLLSGDVKPNFNELACKPFPVLCVISNYEPSYKFFKPVEDDIGIGEKIIIVKKKNPLVAYLKPGKVYTIDNIKILVLGGALPSEKINLERNELWCDNKFWTEQKKNDLFKLLEIDNNFDFVLSHTGFHHKENLFLNGEALENDKYYSPLLSYDIEFLYDEIRSKIKFNSWLCGHFQNNISYFYKHYKHSYHYIPTECKLMEKKDDEIITFDGSWSSYGKIYRT